MFKVKIDLFLKTIPELLHVSDVAMSARGERNKIHFTIVIELISKN